MISSSILLLFAIMCGLSESFIFKDMPITATAEKTSYVVGDTVEIACTCIDKTLLTKSKLYFFNLKTKKDFTNTGKNFQMISINKGTILLKLTNVIAGHHYIGCGLTNNTNLHHIGTFSFDVGNPPELSSIKFVNLDYNQLSVYVNPANEDLNEYWKVTWTFRDQLRRSVFNENCPCLTNTCQCTNPFHCIVQDGCYYRNIQYQFTVVGINFYGLFNKTYDIKSNFEIVKLHQLRKLKVNANISSLTVSWLWSLQTIVHSTTQCRLSYKSQWDYQEHSIETDESSVVLKNLMPYTMYSLKLQCKLSDSEYWSDTVTIANRTLPHVPQLAPPTINGSYYDWPCLDETSRCLTVFWKQIPEVFPLHLIDFQQVEVTGTNSNTEEILEIAPDAISAHLTNLSKYDKYLVRISIIFKNGKKSAVSYQYIPEHNISEKPTAVTVERNENEYLIKWSPKMDSTVFSKNIIWCLGEVPSDILSCKKISWITTVGSEARISLDSQFKNSLSFAVSYNSAEGSSGLTQADCIMNSNQVNLGGLQKPEAPIVFPTHLADGVGLYVVLPIIKCNRLLALPTYFVVTYKAGSDCINGKERLVKTVGIVPALKSIKLYNLLPDTDYAVCISVKGEDSLTLLSNPTVMKTPKTVPVAEVKELKVVNGADSNVMLSWKHSDTNGIITHFELSYMIGNSSMRTSVKVPAVRNIMHYMNLDNLESFTNYFFTVSACNLIGCGPKKSHINYTTSRKDQPAQLVLTALTERQLLVNWTNTTSHNYYQIVVQGEHPYSINATEQFLLNVTCPIVSQQGLLMQLGIQPLMEDGTVAPGEMDKKNVTMCLKNIGLKTFSMSEENYASSSSGNK